MSDQMTQGAEQQQAEDNLKKLRDKADLATKLERENVMLKAGVDFDHPASSYFLDGYKGELTTDAIKAEWLKLAGPPAAPAQQGEQQQEELTAEQQEQLKQQQLQQHLEDEVRRGISSAHTDPNAQSVGDPVASGFDAFHEARRNGATFEKAAENVTSAILTDPERQWNGWTDEQLQG